MFVCPSLLQPPLTDYKPFRVVFSLLIINKAGV